MIVILDCHLILSYALSNKLYEASKHLLIYWLEKSVQITQLFGHRRLRRLVHLLGFTYGQLANRE